VLYDYSVLLFGSNVLQYCFTQDASDRHIKGCLKEILQTTMKMNIRRHNMVHQLNFTKTHKAATNKVITLNIHLNKGVSKSFWTGCLEQEPQMVELSATRCSCIAIL
jgi:hypothetical protein